MAYFLRNQVTRYVILFIERDGSTYLTSLLVSHPDVEAIYERFSVMVQRGTTPSEQLDWANNFLSPPLISKSKARGFKTKLVDVLDKDGFKNLLIRKDVKIIQMQRRNRIKAVISRINARRLFEATGNWNLYDKDKRMPPMQVDLTQFHQFLTEREEADEELQKFIDVLQLPTLKIVYEDLLVDKELTLKKTFDFLNIPTKPVNEKTLKHTSDDLRDVIQNFDELRDRYAGTIYEPMFDEVLL